MPAPLHRTVRSLGLVSLLTDASSEMIYPLLPAFLTGTLRAGPAFLGIVEGLAETVAAVLKIVSGGLSDRLPRRKPLVVAGYSLSSLVRPLVALATAPVHVLAVRVLDRVGKGVRSAPRDALVAEVVPPEDRGRAFGFQRAMDHAGAMVGPLLASAAMLRDERPARRLRPRRDPRRPRRGDARPRRAGGAAAARSRDGEDDGGRVALPSSRRSSAISASSPSSPSATPRTPSSCSARRRRASPSPRSPRSGRCTTS